SPAAGRSARETWTPWSITWRCRARPWPAVSGSSSWASSGDTSMADLPGMIGPYQVLKRLGTGGMGEVFLAYDERLDRKVAIKRIRSDVGSTPERRERFRREARVAAKLNHPAIVQIYDVLTEEDASYIVMEHVEGTNLRQLLDDGCLPG